MKASQFSIFRAATIAIICSIFFLITPVTEAEAATLSDGTYSINYTVISPDDESASMANDYFVKPAKLFVENGSMKVQLTVKNSKWITQFQAQNGGNSVISSNSSANTRVVQFNVSSLSNPTVAKIKVDIDDNDMDYHHNYSIRLKFEESSASLVSAPATETTSTETPSTETKNDAAGSSNSNTSSDSSETSAQPTENPKTSDSAQLGMFVVLLLASSIFLTRKFKRQ